MKKIFSICALIIVAAIVVTVFSACGGKTGTDTTTTSAVAGSSQNNATVVIGNLTLKVNQNNAEVYNDGALLQVLSYPQGKGTPFSYDYAKEHYGFIDMNFDGEFDIYIAVADDEGIIYYYCWLFNATKMEFQYSITLSALTNISVDNAEQLIYAIGFDAEGNKVISKYTFVDGSLKFIESFNESDDIPADVEQNVNDSAIGNKPVEDNTSVDANKPSNGGTTGETKPLLTTEPNSGSGIILVDPTEEVWY